MNVVAIPARVTSTRLPRKPLLCETGLPLVVHTARNAESATMVDEVVVVTDSLDIDAACRDFHVPVVIAQGAWCGTQRIAMALERKLFDGDVILNVQCDEPCVPPAALDMLVESVLMHDDQTVSTLASVQITEDDLANRNVVKVAVSNDGHRTCDAFFRDTLDEHVDVCHHIGVYGFHKTSLLHIRNLAQSWYSEKLSLEQITWMESGYRIVASLLNHAPLSINTEEDYGQFVKEHMCSHEV